MYIIFYFLSMHVHSNLFYLTARRKESYLAKYYWYFTNVRISIIWPTMHRQQTDFSGESLLLKKADNTSGNSPLCKHLVKTIRNKSRQRKKNQSTRRETPKPNNLNLIFWRTITVGRPLAQDRSRSVTSRSHPGYITRC